MNPIWLAMWWHWMHVFGKQEPGCEVCGLRTHKAKDCTWSGKS